MPRATWKNLAPERRERILAAAMEEFGQHGYSAGSLAIVADAAGVAKGALLQYFDDKLEFFTYITELVAGEVHEAMHTFLEPRPTDASVCDYLTRLTDGWIDYMARNPLQRGITAAAMLEIDPQVRRAIRQPVHRLYVTTLRPLLLDAVDAGELRRDTDVDALLTLLELLLPHLALAPFEPGLDTAVKLHGTTGKVRSERARRLVGALFAGSVAGSEAVPERVPG